MGSAYQQTLMRLSKTFDLYPWIEVMHASLPFDTTEPTAVDFDMKRNYGVVFNEMPFVAHVIPRVKADAEYFKNWGLRGGSFEWSVGAGVGKRPQASSPVLVSNILGTYTDEWIKQGAGVYLPADSTFSARFFYVAGTGSDPDHKCDGHFWLGLRGYQLWPKGSVRPTQYSRTELLKQGNRLTPYKTAKAVTVYPNASTDYVAKTESSGTADVVFEDAQIVHRIRAAPTLPATFNTEADGRLIQATLIKIKSNRGLLMNDFVPFQMIQGLAYSTAEEGEEFAGPRARTQWNLEKPLIVDAGDQWSLEARPMVEYGPAMAGTTILPGAGIEVVFDGERVRKPKK